MSDTGFVALPGGAFTMGSDRHYPEEAPSREVTVAGFEIGATAVTNAQYAAFVDATGYVTVAERPPDPADLPGADPADLVPGSLVFRATDGPVDLRDWRRWWAWVPGAWWRRPRGPESDLSDRADHPVVQVAHEDAVAYATWTGARLPTEAEWEYAARGGLEGATYAWGEEANDGGRHANTWQGRFPYRNDGAAGWRGTASVGSFAPNGFGLHEMTGNTWEWTSTAWTRSHRVAPACACSPAPDAGGTDGAEVRVLKGGSHLCAPEYCLRYRPAARSPQSTDSATTHLGFRCVR